jgi:hypothetical protein
MRRREDMRMVERAWHLRTLVTVPASTSSVEGSASTQASPRRQARLGAGFPPWAVQAMRGEQQ